MEHLVFVYGTLKQGFRNFHVNHGRRLSGDFVTAQPQALLIVGEYWLPWLLEASSESADGDQEILHVTGQVFAVDDAGLAEMDKLEQIDEEGWYLRRRIEVRPHGDDGAPTLTPWVYFGSREGLARGGQHIGPLTEYTLAHQALAPPEP